MADSESAALTGLGDTPVLGAVGETRTLMALTTATSRLRVYQFRHDRPLENERFQNQRVLRQMGEPICRKAAYLSAESGWIANRPCRWAPARRRRQPVPSSVRW